MKHCVYGCKLCKLSREYPCCERVYEAFTVPGGADDPLSIELGGLYDGLHKLHNEYIAFVSTQTELYRTPFPFCSDHLTIVLLESAVHENRHVQLLKHYLDGNMEQSKEAWMLLSNCPKGCRLKKCYNISPNIDYYSAECEHQHVAEQAEAKRELAEQARVAYAPVEQKKKPNLYHIGTGDGIGKSLRFWVNEQTITIGYALGQQSIKLADVVFYTACRQDECHHNGRRNHRHSIKYAKRLLDIRLKEFARVYANSLTPNANS